jgi:hypothetical protein
MPFNCKIKDHYLIKTFNHNINYNSKINRFSKKKKVNKKIIILRELHHKVHINYKYLFKVLNNIYTP